MIVGYCQVKDIDDIVKFTATMERFQSKIYLQKETDESLIRMNKNA